MRTAFVAGLRAGGRVRSARRAGLTGRNADGILVFNTVVITRFFGLERFTVEKGERQAVWLETRSVSN